MKKQWSMILAIILFLGVAILSVLNVDPVPVNFGFAVVEWPLIVVIFTSVLLGALIATLLSTYKAIKDQREHKHQEKIDARSESASGASIKKTRSDKVAENKTDSKDNTKGSESSNDDIL